ncbi:LOB domain-containing protein 41-like [Typha latifolia]|uniref:LOB domain-containing protein 41-like n=1 Tax=Typha latifolia TaxID=4733 RepID=UPI003C2C180A
MRMSCNGCRVLRKGCSDDCVIRPCLQWIQSPEAQANATLFLAKFYGRAGLVNLISAGPVHLRPAIFRSMLFEACGRVLNPIYGSVGLLWSGSWQRCQAAVEAVLKGMSITQISTAVAAVPPLKTCDIRHVARNPHIGVAARSRARFKRAGLVVPVSRENDSDASVETVDASHVSQSEQYDAEVGLDLTLALFHRAQPAKSESGDDTYPAELGSTPPA